MSSEKRRRIAHEDPKTIGSEDRSEGRARTGASGSRGMNTEHVDIGLARYSDWAFTSSVVVLVAALLLLAVELAYSRGRKTESRGLVGAATAGASGTSSTAGAARVAPGVVADARNLPRDVRVGKAGLALVYVGIGLLRAPIVLRGL